MCGRFTNRYTWSELVRLYRLTGSPPASNFPPRYNVAPTQTSFVVRLRDGQRELADLRWGLVPLWSKDLGPMDSDRVETFTILTCEPNEFMAPIHNRMPVLLPQDAWPVWLGETGAGPEQLQALCKPFPSERMISWAVTPRVGNVRNTDAALVEPFPEAAE